MIRGSTITVEIQLTACCEPDNSEAEIEQQGYTETEPLPTLRSTDSTETEADLIDTIVSERYGLTEEELEIVQKSVGN